MNEKGSHSSGRDKVHGPSPLSKEEKGKKGLFSNIFIHYDLPCFVPSPLCIISFSLPHGPMGGHYFPILHLRKLRPQTW